MSKTKWAIACLAVVASAYVASGFRKPRIVVELERLNVNIVYSNTPRELPLAQKMLKQAGFSPEYFNKINQVRISDDKLSDGTIRSISTEESIESLIIVSEGLTGKGLAHLRKLKGLYDVIFVKKHISEKFVSGLVAGTPKKMRWVRLVGKHVDAKAMSLFSGREYNTLLVCGENLSDSHLKKLGGLTARFVVLIGGQFSVDAVRSFRKRNSVMSLEIYSPALGAKAAKELGNLRFVQILKRDDVRYRSYEGMRLLECWEI